MSSCRVFRHLQRICPLVLSLKECSFSAVCGVYSYHGITNYCSALLGRLRRGFLDHSPVHFRGRLALDHLVMGCHPRLPGWELELARSLSTRGAILGQLRRVPLNLSPRAFLGPRGPGLIGWLLDLLASVLVARIGETFTDTPTNTLSITMMISSTEGAPVYVKSGQHSCTTFTSAFGRTPRGLRGHRGTPRLKGL